MIQNDRALSLDYNKTKNWIRKVHKGYSKMGAFEDVFHDTYLWILCTHDRTHVHILTLFAHKFKALMQKHLGVRNVHTPKMLSVDLMQEGLDNESRPCYPEELMNIFYEHTAAEDSHFDRGKALAYVEGKATLTDNEKQVFHLLMNGWQGVEVANTLGVSPQAVNSYRKRAHKKIKETVCPLH